MFYYNMTREEIAEFERKEYEKLTYANPFRSEIWFEPERDPEGSKKHREVIDPNGGRSKYVGVLPEGGAPRPSTLTMEQAIYGLAHPEEFNEAYLNFCRDIMEFDEQEKAYYRRKEAKVRVNGWMKTYREMKAAEDKAAKLAAREAEYQLNKDRNRDRPGLGLGMNMINVAEDNADSNYQDTD
jgi:hypothetical protein